MQVFLEDSEPLTQMIPAASRLKTTTLQNRLILPLGAARPAGALSSCKQPEGKQQKQPELKQVGLLSVNCDDLFRAQDLYSGSLLENH